MKKYFVFLLSMLLYIPFSYADTTNVTSSIDAVTVFFNGAQINRVIKADLKLGTQMLKVEKLPVDLDANSIQVRSGSGMRILSIKHELSPVILSKKTAREIELEHEEKIIKDQIESLKELASVYTHEYNLLMANTKLSTSHERVPITELKEAADFYRDRLMEINQLQEDLKIAVEKEQKKLKKIYRERSQIKSEKSKEYSHLLLFLEVSEAGNKKLALSYYSKKAGWRPTYDIRVSDISSELLLVTKAKVFQQSGEIWKDIDLELSTSNPQKFDAVPILSTWYLGSGSGQRVEYQRQEKAVNPYTDHGRLQGTIMDLETKEALPFVDLVLSQNDQDLIRTSTDFDGRYVIKKIEAGQYNLQISSIGYSPKVISRVMINGGKITFLDSYLDPGIDLEELQVVAYSTPMIDTDRAYSRGTVTSEDIAKMPMRDATSVASTVAGMQQIRGGRAENTYYYIDGNKVKANKLSIPSSAELFSSLDLESIKSNEIIQEFKIEDKCMIPSDGDEYTFSLKEDYLDVVYVYRIIPKLDNTAYLSAKIGNWNELNLLSGSSNIYYKGTYIGESFIDADFLGDSISISLGKDKNVLVSRDPSGEEYQSKMTGNNIKDNIAWTIKIRNNNPVTARVDIIDQLPISRYKQISIEHIDLDGAKVNELNGMLTWSRKIAAYDKAEIKFSYSIKYPKALGMID